MITATMTVAEVLERHPKTLAIFRDHGFNALANPVLRRTFAHLITVAGACTRHGVPIETFLDRLNAATDERHPAAPSPISGAPVSVPNPPSPTPDRGPIHPGMNIGEAVGRHPRTRPVFDRFFGGGCFTCPSFGQEDVAFACQMHGTDVEQFVAACNRAVAEGGEDDLTRLTLTEILRRHPGTAPVLVRHGLDACCGGGRTLAEAAAAHHIALQDILAGLRQALRSPPLHSTDV